MWAENISGGIELRNLAGTGGTQEARGRWTFVGKVMSQLSRLVITFLPRSKRLLISWLQSPSCSDF